MQQPSNDTFERIFTADEKATLGGELFLNRELVGVDFSGADLRGARFERTTLVRCNLAAADVRGAHFILCDLHAVVLADVLFEDNRFDGTTLVDAVGLTADGQAVIEGGGGTFQHVHASLR
jgi:uncharacterized protein YjbI with pentapeptide repeats